MANLYNLSAGLPIPKSAESQGINAAYLSAGLSPSGLIPDTGKVAATAALVDAGQGDAKTGAIITLVDAGRGDTKVGSLAVLVDAYIAPPPSLVKRYCKIGNQIFSGMVSIE